MTFNGAKLTIKLIVDEIETDLGSNALFGPASHGKQNEYVIIDINRSHRNCLYVVQKIIRINGKTSQPCYLCYDVAGIGEREQRWPEIPVVPESKVSLRLYSIDCKCIRIPRKSIA